MATEKILTEEQLEKQKILRNGMFGGVFLIVAGRIASFSKLQAQKKTGKATSHSAGAPSNQC